MLDMIGETQNTGAEKMTGTLTGLTMSKTPGPVRLHGVEIGRTIANRFHPGWLHFVGTDDWENWGTGGDPSYLLAALDREAHARVQELR